MIACVDSPHLLCALLRAGSSRVVNVLSKLGFGAPGASALRKQTKRFRKAAESKQQQQADQLKELSMLEFEDNIENYRRKHCRSRKNKRYAPYKARMVRMTMYVPPSNPHHRAQFTSPLRQSPLPALTIDAFEPSADGKQALADWREQSMLRTMALSLVSPFDPVCRQLAIKSRLHVDGLGAKCCVNATCRERFGKLHDIGKRKCKASHVAVLFVILAAPLLIALSLFVGSDARATCTGWILLVSAKTD